MTHNVGHESIRLSRFPGWETWKTRVAGYVSLFAGARAAPFGLSAGGLFIFTLFLLN